VDDNVDDDDGNNNNNKVIKVFFFVGSSTPKTVHVPYMTVETEALTIMLQFIKAFCHYILLIIHD
jgi:hypothetical protein